MLKGYKEGVKMIVQCLFCDREEDYEKAKEENWLIIETPLGEIVEVYCFICRMVFCPNGKCLD